MDAPSSGVFHDSATVGTQSLIVDSGNYVLADIHNVGRGIRPDSIWRFSDIGVDNYVRLCRGLCSLLPESFGLVNSIAQVARKVFL